MLLRPLAISLLMSSANLNPQPQGKPAKNQELRQELLRRMQAD